MSNDLEQCRAVLKKRCKDLLAHKNVVATGVGYKMTGGQISETLGITCSVIKKEEANSLRPEDMIPQAVDGVPTDVVETGEITAFQDPKGRFRPAPGGVSLGHFDITAGTLGCLVRKNGTLYILSNNHVIANSNNAQAGDSILQPGPFDGGRDPQDRIATLSEFVPISFQGGGGGDGGGDGGGGGGGGDDGGCFGCAGGSSSPGDGTGGWAASTQAVDNLVDAAIARPLEDSAVENTILDIGTIAGTGTGVLGLALKKSGRTTGFTTGSVIQIDVTVDVSYGAGLVARFTDQLMAGAMSEGGDSGSAVLDNSNNLVGLLFAGSSTTTIINRIENVFSALGLTLA